ncbi:MAG: DUF4159 domain-containing protein [Pseudomonadota bacterium]
MLSLGPLAFLNPWLLSALALLPIAYLIIRAIPPAPRRLFFPATWLTRELDTQSAEVEATPWWLLLLRLLMLALLIIAMAHPILAPNQRLASQGPVIVLVDNDWTAAPDWPARQDAILALLEQLGSQERSVHLATTAAPLEGWSKTERTAFYSADLAAEHMRALEPSPWGPDYTAALEALRVQVQMPDVSLFYLTSGINHGAAAPFLSELSALAPLDLTEIRDAALRQLAFAAVKPSAQGFDLLILRRGGTPPLTASVLVSDSANITLARQEVRFERGQTRADAALSVPLQLRGRVARLSIEGVRSAGASYVLDARSQRPLVGIIDTPSVSGNAPFQTPQFYLKRALSPYATLERGAAQRLLKSAPAILLLPDHGRLPDDIEQSLSRWIETGGLLVRFAGPALLADEASLEDPLLPIALRSQPRVVGGTLSWSSALRVAAFDEDSPFAGLIPSDEITIDRQALARSGTLQQSQIWATLSDGTPLVSTATRGSGRLVLFHTSADPQWSNLAISGTFVEMLQRLLHFSGPGQAPSAQGSETMTLTQLMGGRGSLVSPPESVAIKPYAQPFAKPAGPDNPPGIYETKNTRIAINLAGAAGPISPRTSLRPLQDAAGAIPIRDIDGVFDRSLRPAVFASVVMLALLDALACLWLRGNVTAPRALKSSLARAGTAALASIATFSQTPDAQASNPADVASNVRLACITTGVNTVDSLCLEGLNGLVRQLNLRTSVWTGPTQMVDLSDDNLGLYPILFWPLQATQAPLTSKQSDHLSGYMRGGGMLVIDLGVGLKGQARMDTQLAPADLLADLRSKITFPPLSPLTKEHVLTHSFYILSRTPGRRGDGQLWVESGGEAQGATVSPIVLGNADWLSSWANVQTSLPGYAGGDGRRDELAVRFGINVVMYALTGTYKADQVHLPALLERVGRGE